MADDMSVSELKIAINSANNVLEMLAEGKKLERWQVSKIVLASDYLSSVCTNMRADTHLEDYEDEEESEEDEDESEESEPEEEEETVNIVLTP